MTALSGARRNGPWRSAGLSAAMALALIVAFAKIPLTIPSAEIGVGLGLWWIALLVLLTRSFGGDGQALGFAELAQGAVPRFSLVFAASALLIEGALSAALSISMVRDWLLQGAQSWGFMALSPSPWLGFLLGLGLLLLVVMVMILGLPGESLGASVLLVVLGLAALVLSPLARGVTTTQAVFGNNLGLYLAPLVMSIPMYSLGLSLKPPRRRALIAGQVALVVMALWAGSSILFSASLSTPLASGQGFLLVALVPLLLLYVVHRFTVAYAVIAGLERNKLLGPRSVARSARLGAPLGVVVSVSVLIALLLLIGPEAKASLIAIWASTSVAGGGLGLRMAIPAIGKRQFLNAALGSAVAAGAVFFIAWLSIAAWAPSLLAVSSAGAMTGAIFLGVLLRPKLPRLRASTVEQLSAQNVDDMSLLTLHEAQELADTHRARVMVATLQASPAVLERAMMRAEDDRAFYLLYVDELAGMLYPPDVSPSAKAQQLLSLVSGKMNAKDFEVIPIWRIAHDPAASIAQAAKALNVDRVIVDPVHNRPLAEVLRGQTLGRLRSLLGEISLEVVMA